jgi:polysaccharide transporter, PST family
VNLLKTSFFAAIATFVRILASFVIGKLIATFSGPAGLALVGQFQNFAAIVQGASGGLISTGVVKYVAQYKENRALRDSFIASGFMFLMVVSGVFSLILMFGCHYWSRWLLKSNAYAHVFIIMGIGLFFYALNIFLVALVNAHKDIKLYTYINVTNSLFTLLFSIVLIYFYSVEGALIALAINQSVVCFVTILFVLKKNWFSVSAFFNNYNKSALGKLSQYALMTLVSLLMLPVAQIILRTYITNHLGWQDAGYWQGVSKISDAYLQIITISLSVYYLPRLSELACKKKVLSEMLSGFKIIIPIVALAAFVVYLLKYYIVLAVYTPDFLASLGLFKWQLMGDVVKICSWLLTYVMLSKALVKIFIFSEIFFTASYVLITMLMIHFLGLVGMTAGFFVNYVLYFLFSMVMFFWWYKYGK